MSWFALFAPANTPKPIVDKWATEVRRVLKLPDVAKRLADNGFEPVGSTPEELAAYQKTEIAKWAKVVRSPARRRIELRGVWLSACERDGRRHRSARRLNLLRIRRHAEGRGSPNIAMRRMTSVAGETSQFRGGCRSVDYPVVVFAWLVATVSLSAMAAFAAPLSGAGQLVACRRQWRRHHGSFNGARMLGPGFAAGQHGQAFNFDGVDDYVHVGMLGHRGQ